MRIERQVVFWLAALVATVLVVGALRDILLPFILGVVIAYALNPIVDGLMRAGLSRTLASAIIMGVGIAVFAAFLIIVAPLVVSQAQKLILGLPEQLQQLRAVIETIAREQLGPRFPEFQAALDRGSKMLSENWTNIASVAARSLWDNVRSLFNLVSLMLVTPLVTFYMLVDWHPSLDKLDVWLPRDHAPAIRRLAGEIDNAVSAFIRGQGVVCLILAFFYALSLSAVGLEYGLLVGIATGVLAFVPFVGWALGLLTALALALVQFWPDVMKIGMVALVFLVGQGLDAGFLSPKIVGSRIGLHPVWLLLALFVFSYLFGFVGALVAVPVAAALAVVVRHALAVYLASDLYKGGGARP
jgi:predicted PurR-regulated permease PerM